MAGDARRRVLGQQVQVRLVDVFAHEAHAVAVGRALLHGNGHRAAVDAIHVQVELVVELGAVRIKRDGERPVGVLLGAFVVQRVAERVRFLAVVDEPLRFAARHHVEALDGCAARVRDVGGGRRLLRARKVGLQHHALARHQVVGHIVVDRGAAQLVARAGEALAADLQLHAGIGRRVHRGLVARNGRDLGRRQLDAGVVHAHSRGAQRQHGIAELKRRVHRARARAMRSEAHEQVAGLRAAQVHRHDVAVAREGQLLGLIVDVPADGDIGEVALGHLQLQHRIALPVKVETDPDLRFHARHDGAAIGHHAALPHDAALRQVRGRIEHGHVKGNLRLRAILNLHVGARVLHAFLKFQAIESGQRGHPQIDARVAHGDHRVCARLQAVKRKRQLTCGIGQARGHARAVAEHHHIVASGKRRLRGHLHAAPCAQIHVERAVGGYGPALARAERQRIVGRHGKRELLRRIRHLLREQHAQALAHVVGVFALAQHAVALAQLEGQAAIGEHGFPGGRAVVAGAHLLAQVHVHQALHGQLLKRFGLQLADVPRAGHGLGRAREHLVVAALQAHLQRGRRARQCLDGERAVRGHLRRGSHAVLEQRYLRPRGNLAGDLGRFLHPLERVGGLARVVLVFPARHRVGGALDPRRLARRVPRERHDGLSHGERVIVLFAVDLQRAAVLVFGQLEVGVEHAQRHGVALPLGARGPRDDLRVVERVPAHGAHACRQHHFRTRHKRHAGEGTVPDGLHAVADGDGADMAAAFECAAFDGFDGAGYVDLGERLGRLALHVDARRAICKGAVVDGLHACGDACHYNVIEHTAAGERLGGDGFEHVVVLRPLHRLQLFAFAEHVFAKRLQAAGQRDGLQLRSGERTPAQVRDAGIGGERDRGQVRRAAAADGGDGAAVNGCRDLERDRADIDVVHGQLVRFLVQRQPDLRGRCLTGNIADVAVCLVAGDALGGCQQVFAVVLVVDVGGLGAVVVRSRAGALGVGVGVEGEGGVGCAACAGARRRRACASLRALQILAALRTLSVLRVGRPFAARNDLRAYDEHTAISGVRSSAGRIGCADRGGDRITVSGIAGVSSTVGGRTGSVRPQALTRRGDGFRALCKTGHGHQARRQNARQRHRRPATPNRPPRTRTRTRRTRAPLRHFRPIPTGPATPFRSHSALLPISAPRSNDKPPTQRTQTSNPPCIIPKTRQNN